MSLIIALFLALSFSLSLATMQDFYTRATQDHLDELMILTTPKENESIFYYFLALVVKKHNFIIKNAEVEKKIQSYMPLKDIIIDQPEEKPSQKNTELLCVAYGATGEEHYLEKVLSYKKTLEDKINDPDTLASFNSTLESMAMQDKNVYDFLKKNPGYKYTGQPFPLVYILHQVILWIIIVNNSPIISCLFMNQKMIFVDYS